MGQKETVGSVNTPAAVGIKTKQERKKSLSQLPTGRSFTDYVRALAERCEGLNFIVEEVLEKLRGILKSEMRQRSLWTSPPSYVGIVGYTRWTSLEPSSALEELLSDCYVFIFCDRLPRLKANLKVNGTIDGLVIFYLRNFLFQRQKDHDPLGYRIFEVVRVAVRGAVEVGGLYVLDGDRKIRNNTILASSPDVDPSRLSGASELKALVACWNDHLLPDLVIAERAERREVIERLQDCLLDLEIDRVTVFSFKDLVDTLKQDVRARWAALYHQHQPKSAIEWNDDERALVRLFRPAFRLEKLDSFKKLVACVAGLIESFDGRKKTQKYLKSLWSFLRRFAADDDGPLPSNRNLEKTLKIPRGRFPGLYKTLGQLIRQCQAILTGKVVKLGPEHHPDGGGQSD